MTVQSLRVERDSHNPHVAIITLNDPDKRNALDAAKASALENAIIELEATRQTDQPVRVIVIRGEGPAFCAGADLSGGVYARDFFDSLTRMLTAIARCPIPVIADVQGPAVGAGCQVVLACDLRVFGDRGAVWVPAAQHGFALDTWTHQRLCELVGGGHARNIMIGAATMGVEQALATGFASLHADPAGAVEYARTIAAQAPLSMEHSKRVLNSADASRDPSLDMLFRKAWASEDAQEARAARAEKRVPRFRGQ
ncbi:enoyl-CoA hydratase [Corynebacterium sp. 320]|uniref:enoyl-CoA hydratase n=1 Tax=Corynebacterium TaxID=1716 RepID=UPI00125CB773|nr:MULTISPECIES: enoyl-CoA hydratase [Corynebacterium]KAB1501326.1 enoyl-CoA hydratase [Corynebacterium sp. 320]KAB1551495.1 enoyl-CoA hydratase [Corynebacterium sp. 321]KAB1551677.1 enoyl-CoA hydratase [Corynebacterium sp. 319]KAB3525691.1 enoyl-CoA hydratase [Corynebacterium sp. 250]KAB3538667.1 enoyl-CoA hydratase [Corynebacterium sp. 366]